MLQSPSICLQQFILLLQLFVPDFLSANYLTQMPTRLLLSLKLTTEFLDLMAKIRLIFEQSLHILKTRFRFFLLFISNCCHKLPMHFPIFFNLLLRKFQLIRHLLFFILPSFLLVKNLLFILLSLFFQFLFKLLFKMKNIVFQLRIFLFYTF